MRLPDEPDLPGVWVGLLAQLLHWKGAGRHVPSRRPARHAPTHSLHHNLIKYIKNIIQQVKSSLYVRTELCTSMLPETESCACVKEDKCACTRSCAPSGCQRQTFARKRINAHAHRAAQIQVVRNRQLRMRKRE